MTQQLETQPIEQLQAERARMIAFAERMKKTRPLVTIGLLVTCMIMFAGQLAWSGIDYAPGIVRMGANVPQLVKDGQFYRLVSCMFLHGGFEHIAMNMFVLFYLGGFCERLFGGRRFLVLYTASGLCGSMASAFVSGEHMSLGASGALWGMLGGLAALAFRPGNLVPRAFLPRLKRAALINLAINVPVSFLPRVDMFAHFGGGLAGALLIGSGLLIPKIESAASEPAPVAGRRSPGWLGPAWVLSAAALLGGLVMAVWIGAPWQLSKPMVWHERQLGDTGIKVAIPTDLLGEPRAVDRKDGVLEFVAGKLEYDPLMLDFVAFPLERTGLGSDDLEKVLDQLKALRTSQTPQGASRTEQVRKRTLGGRMTVEDAFRFDNGLKLMRFSQVRGKWVFHLEAVVWPAEPAKLGLDVERALAP